ncbi:gamma-butyrobetaine hydroxylase-like domain-containing protein [Endozoicomonas ascidiicola]|uniref:gamma-butyrobetaine hydroxylase-like domain-containing protein n=1 Tax=Endozoicomonas ascidiicola TaxID=1698521 RepID=UPI00083158C8|nr:DUF971 domain-containing protein [Endozoicomonas ascidiicola]
MTSKIPSAIKLHKQSNVLEIQFGYESFHLEAEFLRVLSPSAEVRGHGNPVLQTGKLHVALTGVQMVGQYAIKLIFDDGHDSGIYDWNYLYELCHEKQRFWDSYLKTLREAGANRDPDVSVVKLFQ